MALSLEMLCESRGDRSLNMASLKFSEKRLSRTSSSTIPETDERQFKLTPKGLQQITTAAVFNESRPFVEIRRDLPLLQLTGFEMAKRLQLEGWQWHRFPRSTKAREQLVYDTSAGCGSWFTLGMTLVPS